MIEEIRATALEKARTRMSFLFSDQHSLDQNIQQHRWEQANALAQAESLLNMNVQHKLDALKRAVDLMDDSSVKLDELTANMKQVDERIAATNSTLSDYKWLKNVDKARDNIRKLIAQVEFFARVPERVQDLRKMLDSDESKMRLVFLESLKLESLRSAFMKEIMVYHNKRSGKGAQDTRITEDTDPDDDPIPALVRNHLKIVPELSKEILQRLFGNIERMNDLAIDSPENLVATFEIIEMYQEYVNRKGDNLQGEWLRPLHQHI